MKEIYGAVTDEAKHLLDGFFMGEGINLGTFLEAIAGELRDGHKVATNRLLDRARREAFERSRRPKGGQPE